jgi:hypothetical protein
MKSNFKIYVKIKYQIVDVIVKNHNVLKNIVNVSMQVYSVIISVNVNNARIYKPILQITLLIIISTIPKIITMRI